MINACVIGLGYVGLPILINLSKKFKTIGYDINKQRIDDLKKGKDLFNEFKKKELKKNKINFTNSIDLIKKSNLFIISVPTPINKKKQPDLTHLKDVCNKLSKIIKKKDIIIFESTVYPGLTNDFCIPLIEKKNNFKEGVDFYVGYSPERVNPGDKNHTLKNINKILAYPHNYRKKELIKVYSLISKKIIWSNNISEAETAKVIENIQRDVNIGLINEFYLVCKRLNLDFNNVINLASSKWNFIKFKPGLVGGHCLPVDPYYFSFISKKNNFDTKITLAGRTTNNLMTTIVKKEITEKLKKIDPQKNKKILFCGLTYKKNVADLRNSLSLKIFQSLKKNNKKIKGYDPTLNNLISKKNNLVISSKEFKSFDIYILATNHSIISRDFKKLNKNKTIINILD
ncbi:nucleotide sugar dehydrogenase [Candidatus Pelagibacter ubique]|nr:nucleotide sugar dehydrogenase [Candidatus Pelagibacter ubique]